MCNVYFFPTLYFYDISFTRTPNAYTTHTQHATTGERTERRIKMNMLYTHHINYAHSKIQLSQPASQPAIHLHLHIVHVQQAGRQADTLTHSLSHSHTTKTIHTLYAIQYMRWQQIKSIKIRKSFFPFTSFCFWIFSLWKHI